MNVHNMLFGGKHKLQNHIFHIHTCFHIMSTWAQTHSICFLFIQEYPEEFALATSIAMSEIWKGKGRGTERNCHFISQVLYV